MGHPKPIAELDIVEIGHDPAPELISEWLQPVLDGADAAVLSESGCPGVADPGAQIAARAHELGIRVVPLTGPSSILFDAHGFWGSTVSASVSRATCLSTMPNGALPFWLPKSEPRKRNTALYRNSVPQHGAPRCAP